MTDTAENHGPDLLYGCPMIAAYLGLTEDAVYHLARHEADSDLPHGPDDLRPPIDARPRDRRARGRSRRGMTGHVHQGQQAARDSQPTSFLGMAHQEADRERRLALDVAGRSPRRRSRHDRAHGSRRHRERQPRRDLCRFRQVWDPPRKPARRDSRRRGPRADNHHRARPRLDRPRPMAFKICAWMAPAPRWRAGIEPLEGMEAPPLPPYRWKYRE